MYKFDIATAMRPFLISILAFFVLTTSAQVERKKLFKKTEYINGNFYKQTSETVAVAKEPIDIYFFNRHFFLPNYLPEKFIDKQYKNRKLSVWGDPNGEKDYQLNWENTYSYDSIGRLTNYTYSGCLVCSNFPYNYSVTYNAKGQVEQLYNTVNEKSSFKFYYDSRGNLVKLEQYLQDTLETVIKLVK